MSHKDEVCVAGSSEGDSPSESVEVEDDATLVAYLAAQARLDATDLDQTLDSDAIQAAIKDLIRVTR